MNAALRLMERGKRDEERHLKFLQMLLPRIRNPMSTDEIAVALGMKLDDAWKILDGLFDLGFLVKFKRKSFDQKLKFWKLNKKYGLL